MDENVTLMAVGDIMLSENRGTGEMIKKYGAEYPFEKIKDFLQRADILFGNLENPISSKGLPFHKQDPHITFRATPESVKGLAFCNFDIVSLANNHMTDYGEVAFVDTLDILGDYGLSYVGAGRNRAEARREVIFEKKGVRIAFLAFSCFIMFATKPALRSRYGITQFVIRDARKAIKETRKRADVVVISMHWGLDYTHYPLPFQMEYAREMIDCGAHLIVGHHPHYLQGIEKYKKGIILYSLGNFIFDEPGQETCIFKCEISKYGIERSEMIPAKISKDFQTELVCSSESNRILGKIESLSRAYENYDLTIANRLIDNFVSTNLYIFLKSGNIYTLRNFNSLFLLTKVLSFLLRKIRKILEV